MDKTGIITETRGGYAIDMGNGMARWQRKAPTEITADELTHMEETIIMLCEYIIDQETVK